MVVLSNFRLKQLRTFIDSARITVKGGRGGNGLPKFGGVGGKGGDVFIEACKTSTLLKLKKDFPAGRFTAAPGEDSKRFRILGNPGNDIVIKCPAGVTAVVESKAIGEVNQHGEKLLLVRGGCGGGPQNGYIGQKGQSISLTLDLKLIADVGFVGYPNAGKSSLLKALSKADPKIGSYPFTTIQPKIGILDYEDFRKISAADLPGLIEGAHLNYGMGHQFLKHCQRTKILLFVVDIDGFRLNPMTPFRNALETIVFLNRELELYDEELLNKPALLAVNKYDQDPTGMKFENLKTTLSDIKNNCKNIPSERLPDTIIKFDAIVPISAKFGTNVQMLKDKIRTMIDVCEEEKKDSEISCIKEELPEVIYA